MGNQSSQQSTQSFPQSGGGFTNNFNDLQHTIESIVNASKNERMTETINFSESSDLDLDSVENNKIGGYSDKPSHNFISNYNTHNFDINKLLSSQHSYPSHIFEKSTREYVNQQPSISIGNLPKVGGGNTDTINFSESSDLDLDSLRDQLGGSLNDTLNIAARRSRYLKFINDKIQSAGNSNILSSANEHDTQNLNTIENIGNSDFEKIQNRINFLLRSEQAGGNVNEPESSDINLDSILEEQSGGSRRSRYLKFIPSSKDQSGGNNTLNDLSSIDEKDFQILKDILQKHQSGGNDNLLHTDAEQNESKGDTSGNDLSATSSQKINLNDAELSATSDQPVDFNNMEGGCGCSMSPASDDIVTKPMSFKALTGGKKSKKIDKDSDEKELSDDYESDDESDDSDENEESDEEESEEEESEEDEDFDESSDGDELSRSNDSSSSTSEEKNHKQKRHNKEYVETSDDSQSGGSSENITLDTKYIYSDNNTFYGSDDNSEYYKHLKNRSMIH